MVGAAEACQGKRADSASSGKFVCAIERDRRGAVVGRRVDGNGAPERERSGRLAADNEGCAVPSDGSPDRNVVFGQDGTGGEVGFWMGESCVPFWMAVSAPVKIKGDEGLDLRPQKDSGNPVSRPRIELRVGLRDMSFIMSSLDQLS